MGPDKLERRTDAETSEICLPRLPAPHVGLYMDRSLPHKYVLIDSQSLTNGFVDIYKCSRCEKIDKNYRGLDEDFYLPSKNHKQK